MQPLLSNEQILLSVLEELRGLRQLMQQQTLLSAHASRSQEYCTLYERFRHLLPPSNGLGGAPDIAHLWTAIRGRAGWREHLSPDQLGLLLCRDERQVYALRLEQLDVPAGFVEEVLSRLPRLEQCSVRGMRSAIDCAALQAVPGPFPQLRVLDLQETAVRDEDLVSLTQLLPNLQFLNLTGCASITADGIAMVQQHNGRLQITPPTREAKQLEDAQRALDARLLAFDSPESEQEYASLIDLYGTHFANCERETSLDKQLLALWTALGGTYGWRRRLRPAQLTLLLSRVTNVTDSCLQCAEGPAPHARAPVATTVSPADIIGFVSQVLSRLPKLETLRVGGAPVWPVDWAAMRDLTSPFPALRQARVRHTPYAVPDLMDLVHRVPTLAPRGVSVDLSRLSSAARAESVAAEALGKVEFA